MKPYRFSAFSDEVDPDPTKAFNIMRDLAVEEIQMRSVKGVNVMELNDDQIGEVKTIALSLGLKFHAVGSPVGKTNIEDSQEETLELVKIAADIAHKLDTTRIRIFSFYREKSLPNNIYRNLVIERLNMMTDIATVNGVKLIHENEKDIYGDTAEKCLDLLENVNNLECCFDFANFIQVGQDINKAWNLLEKRVCYFDIKDALTRDGTVVPAGEGDACIVNTLRKALNSGFEDCFNLEPHLQIAGHSGGYSGPQLFKIAVKALEKCLTLASK